MMPQKLVAAKSCELMSHVDQLKALINNAGGLEPEGAIVQGGCLTTYRVQYNGMAWSARTPKSA